MLKITKETLKNEDVSIYVLNLIENNAKNSKEWAKFYNQKIELAATEISEFNDKTVKDLDAADIMVAIDVAGYVSNREIAIKQGLKSAKECKNYAETPVEVKHNLEFDVKFWKEQHEQ